MGILINKRSQIITRLGIGLIIILFTAFSPFIASMIGSWLTELFTNEPCHEGNCFWGAIGWLFLVTFPLSVLLLIIFVIITINDILKLNI